MHLLHFGKVVSRGMVAVNNTSFIFMGSSEFRLGHMVYKFGDAAATRTCNNYKFMFQNKVLAGVINAPSFRTIMTCTGF